MVEFAAERSQTRLYIAKAVPVRELCKGHRPILIPTREASRPCISAVSIHATAKFAIRQEAQQLREDGSALIHAPLWTVPRFGYRRARHVSNRGKRNARSTLSKKSTCQW